MKTETYETVVSHTKTVDETSMTDVSAMCSKGEKEELDDMLSIYEDVQPPLSEYKAARKKFTDNSFLKKFMKIYEWAVHRICGLKKNTPAIAHKK